MRVQDIYIMLYMVATTPEVALEVRVYGYIYIYLIESMHIHGTLDPTDLQHMHEIQQTYSTCMRKAHIILCIMRVTFAEATCMDTYIHMENMLMKPGPATIIEHIGRRTLTISYSK